VQVLSINSAAARRAPSGNYDFFAAFELLWESKGVADRIVSGARSVRYGKHKFKLYQRVSVRMRIGRRNTFDIQPWVQLGVRPQSMLLDIARNVGSIRDLHCTSRPDKET